METIKNRVGFIRNPVSNTKSPRSRPPPQSSMKHSATCEFTNSTPVNASLKSSPSVGNLSSGLKSPYDLLLEQIKRRGDLETSITPSGRQAQSENLTIVGRYTLHEVLGKGSFSKVQLATHQLTKGKLPLRILTNKPFV
ncbi:unnamed protein product [Hydatigera taeniaeformis]|uniref:Protein kinase domain-containing protein n=1 Tax=Hydatigena taeniaeformis TaxID=6205 RepID=A0A0R3X9C4_HYDTA|nr:unnamed protein product [Hydatigera taeniaeformis]